MMKLSTLAVAATLGSLTLVFSCNAAVPAGNGTEQSARVSKAMKISQPPSGKAMPISSPSGKPMPISPPSGKPMLMNPPPPSAKPPLPLH